MSIMEAETGTEDMFDMDIEILWDPSPSGPIGQRGATAGSTCASSCNSYGQTGRPCRCF